MWSWVFIIQVVNLPVRKNVLLCNDDRLELVSLEIWPAHLLDVKLLHVSKIPGVKDPRQDMDGLILIDEEEVVPSLLEAQAVLTLYLEDAGVVHKGTVSWVDLHDFHLALHLCDIVQEVLGVLLHHYIFESWHVVIIRVCIKVSISLLITALIILSFFHL